MISQKSGLRHFIPVCDDPRAWFLRLRNPFRAPLASKRWRRRLRNSLPDGSAVELDRHAVGGVNGPLVGPVDPNAPGVVHPASGRLSGVIQHVELLAVLRDESKTARCAQAQYHTLPPAGQIHALR